MAQATLEHVNMTVSDPKKTAQMLVDLFDWKIRWEGPGGIGGYTVHVGTDDRYLGLYRPGKETELSRTNKAEAYSTVGGLNHVALVVADLDQTETRILNAGFKTLNHGDYEPGRRFYFFDDDGIEYEVVSYS